MAVCSFANQSRRYDSRWSGAYTGGPAKGILHTTEGSSLPGYEGGGTAPHFTVVPNFRSKTVTIYQHFNTNRPARALKNEAGGIQTNNDSAIQIELVGTCDKRTAAKYGGIMYWPEAPTWALDGLAKLMRWIEKNHDVPRVATTRPWLPYPSSYGNSRARMTAKEWDNFSGWAGHMHVDENDHGDPGNINIGYLLAGPSAKTTVVKVGTTITALAAALGLSVTALLGANPSLPDSPKATVTPGTTITIPVPGPTVTVTAPPKSTQPTSTSSSTTIYKVVTTPASKKPVLRKGTAGAAVKTVQRAVGATADGYFGAGTDTKVRAFQRAHGLVPDGVVGARTWAAINARTSTATKAKEAAARPVLRKGAVSRHVRTVQAAVGARVDGVFGAQTDRAVRAYQKRHHLVADGIVGARTWAVIL